MNNSSEDKKQAFLRISQLILSGKSLTRRIEEMQKERFMRDPVVDLNEYRKLRESPPRKTALIADREDPAGSELSRMLEKEGFNLLVAHDAKELGKIIENDPFDLFFVDPALDWLDAHELCYLMKGNKVLRKIPVIFVASDSPKGAIRKAFESGCDEYVTKPINSEKLLRTLKYFLENM